VICDLLAAQPGGECDATTLQAQYRAVAADRYRGRLAEPLTERGVRNVLRHLRERGTVIAEGDGSNRVYRLTHAGTERPKHERR